MGDPIYTQRAFRMRIGPTIATAGTRPLLLEACLILGNPGVDPWIEPISSHWIAAYIQVLDCLVLRRRMPVMVLSALGTGTLTPG